MPPRRPAAKMADGDLAAGLVKSYAVNESMNQIVLEHLAPAAWRAKLTGQGRTIAAIFAHVHNVRRKWLRLSAGAGFKLPAQLHFARCSQEEARSALAESGARCCEMLTAALVESPPRITQFLSDGWVRPWPAGASMAAYMIAHDAHHRGQVCMLAHQLGYPLPVKCGAGIWKWETIWKDCSFASPGEPR